MKAINIKQPWAWAIAGGHKTIETRTWPTNYRGELLIVASKTPDRAMMEWFRCNVGYMGLSEVEYGKAIAVARLAGCRLMTVADEDAAMCDIYNGAYSWVLEDVKKINSFPMTGQLGLYEVPEMFMKNVRGYL